MIKRITFLICVIVALSSCASVRGERVETGFGSGPSTTAAATSAPALAARPASVTTSGSPVELGDQDASASFDFRARELYSGTMIDGNDLFGQGELLVTFVQPGCDISLGGGMTIAEIAELHPEAIFVIVHSGADDEAYVNFAEEAELYQENMVHISDHFGALAARYGIEDYPSTLLIDSDRRITSIVGAMDAEAQVKAVKAVKAVTAAE